MIPLNEDAMIAIKALYSRTLPVDAYQFGDFRLDCGRFELLRNDLSSGSNASPWSR
jgi:hypothetical protein